MVHERQQITDAFIALDRTERFSFCSPEAAALLDVSAEALVGTCLADQVELAAAPFGRACRRALATSTRVTIETQFSGATDWYSVRCVPGGAGLSVYLQRCAAPADSAERVRESEERYRVFLALSSEGIWRFELTAPLAVETPVAAQIEHFYRHAYLAECNDAMARMYGYQHAADLVGVRLGDLLPRSEPGNVAYLSEFISSGYQLRNAESAEYDAANRRRLFANSLTGVVQDGLLLRAWGTQHDITDLKASQAALRASEARYRALSEAIPQIIFTVDAAGATEYVNQQWLDYSGMTPTESLANGWSSALHPDDRPALTASWRRAVVAGQACEAEFRLRRRDGTYRWFLMRTLPLLENGEIVRWYGAATDITERKDMEDEIRRREQQYKTLVQNAPDIIARFDSAFRHLYVSPAVERATGLPTEVFIGRTNRELGMPERLVASWEDTIRRVFESGAAVENEFATTSEHGPRYYEARIVPELTGTAEIESVLCITRDVTDRKLAEVERDELLESEQRARANAEAAVRMRDLFFTLASHELKNPLTTLLGNVELLKRRMAADAAVAPRHHATVETIRAQLIRFNRLINTILDISLIQGGKLTLDRTVVDMAALARRVVADVQPTLNNHALVLEGAERCLPVDGDELRLEQVLQNLLQNAVKYSPQGGDVTLRLECIDRQVCLTVIDQGIGIPAAALPHLFERFYRAEQDEPSKIGGMGIGLYVVKEITTLHGGTVAVSSDAAGSAFKICLPTFELQRCTPALGIGRGADA